MPTYYDSTGKPYALSIEIGRGGEGTVFYCPNDLSLVAKIYHEPIDEEKAEKLQWMAANRNDGLLKVAAWIVDTLHDKPNGKIFGFVMPNVKAKEIHELYSLKSQCCPRFLCSAQKRPYYGRCQSWKLRRFGGRHS
jgi:DNA-binding helix-hairpin-helix protein with protein kinase domain